MAVAAKKSGAPVKSYSSPTEFLADPENEVDEEVKLKFLESDADVQVRVMARGELTTAKDNTKALHARIRDALYDIAIEKGETPPKDSKRRKRKEDGDGPKKHAEIDIDLVHPGASAKTELCSYLQRKLGRAVTKDDVTYETKKTDGVWISTLILPCLGMEVTEGAPEQEQKAAEKSVAKAFLEKNRDEIMQMNLDARPIVVRQRGERGENDKGEPSKKKQKKQNDWDDWSAMAPLLEAVMTMVNDKGSGKGWGSSNWSNNWW